MKENRLLRRKREWASVVAQLVNNLPAVQETQVQSLGQQDLLEKNMVNHSSIFAWKIPWTAEPGGLLSVGSQELNMGLVTKPGCPKHTLLNCQLFFYSLILYESVESSVLNIDQDEALAVCLNKVILTDV